MKEIQLTQGKVALVDDEDYEYLNQYKWYASKDHNTFYATRNTPLVDGKRKTIPMQWYITNEKWIDHCDNNGLNNQKNNLRFATKSENMINRRKQANTSSIYKGVCWRKRNSKWRVYINKNGKCFNLGCFVDEVEAANTYDKKAKELFGEFAYLNFKEQIIRKRRMPRIIRKRRMLYNT